MTQNDVQLGAPWAMQSQGGEALWWMGALAVIRATGADTGGAMTVIEVTEAPGAEAPLHVHRREDEAFWILEGEATFDIGGEVIPAAAGDLLFGPRNVPHRYRVGDRGCRMLFVCTPGGNFEHLVRALSDPAPRRELPPDQTVEPAPEEMERVLGVIAEYGCELLG